MGGLAVVLHGHKRYTQDVDALVWDLDERLESLLGVLEKKGFRPASPNQVAVARSARILHLLATDGTEVDIFLGFLPFEREAVDRAVTMSLAGGESVRVTSVEDVIIMKLIASRKRDRSDIVALLDLYPGINLDRVRSIVSDYADALDDPKLLDSLNDFAPKDES